MTRERFAEQRDDLRNAAARLRQSLAEPETDIVRDAVIQRFEFTFEIVWKTLKLYLEHQGDESGGPRATFKNAFVEGLIRSAEEADVWFRMLEDRNLASHTYREELAREIYARIAREYEPLLSEMAGRIEALTWD